MRITRHVSFDELTPWRARWNELARDVPFRRWEWLAAWWRHYGPSSIDGNSNDRLLLLAVWDDSRLVGVAPWYSRRIWPDGRAIRPLGTGEACSEYLTILCESGCEDAVAGALAGWLAQDAADENVGGIEWDRLDLAGAITADDAVGRLLNRLSKEGNRVYSRSPLSCWRIELPRRWDDFVLRLSKSHRKQVRRAARKLADGRAKLHIANDHKALDEGFKILVDLHQRRWNSLGQRGCFGSSRFWQFHRDCAPELFAAGCLELMWLDLDGTPLAAEYHLVSADTAYAYQSGIDPDRLAEEPGRLATVATIQHHIAQGRKYYDFLRGDEPYKSHWRAAPQRMCEIQVVPRRATARLRHGVLLATDSVKHWIRSGLELAGLR